MTDITTDMSFWNGAVSLGVFGFFLALAFSIIALMLIKWWIPSRIEEEKHRRGLEITEDIRRQETHDSNINMLRANTKAMSEIAETTRIILSSIDDSHVILKELYDRHHNPENLTTSLFETITIKKAWVKILGSSDILIDELDIKDLTKERLKAQIEAIKTSIQDSIK